ncbi:hypothetical protein [Streptomyces sp. NPDC047123]|uniref:hypothetical protein n=1 Tax=Streptomyces sp. NPDC047123 TaxID=3155622 RepID=UPI0033C575B6
MSAATFTPAPASAPSGAGQDTGVTARPGRLGGALRTAKVLLGAAFGVVVLGEFAEEAGVRQH